MKATPITTRMRRLALQESLALRAYARAGKPAPTTRPLILPWHPGYIDTDRRMTGDEVLPDAHRRTDVA
jgi:hypothetical protein